jgi:hypothetical protein
MHYRNLPLFPLYNKINFISSDSSFREMGSYYLTEVQNKQLKELNAGLHIFTV